MIGKFGGVALVAAGVAAFYFASRVKEAVSSLRVTLFGIKYDSKRTKESGYLKLYFNTTLKFENPAPTPLTVDSVDLVFYHNGKPVAGARQGGQLQIPPKSEARAVYQVGVPTFKIVNLLADAVMLVTQKKPLKLAVKGIVNAGAARVTIDENKVIEWPTV